LVGGKTGINTKTAKNLVGTFYQPKCVVVDLESLLTLPRREWLAGYAEIVKYGLLADEGFFEWLEDHGILMLDGDEGSIMRAIETSCHMKADIVHKDEREENGLRALLNLGHTFAHALESAAGYDGTLLHGEAVSIGMVLAARLSQRLGYITLEDVNRIYMHLSKVGLMTEIRHVKFKTPVTSDQMIESMRKDKKAGVGGLKFVILKKIGEAELEGGIAESLIKEILEESLK